MVRRVENGDERRVGRACCTPWSVDPSRSAPGCPDERAWPEEGRLPTPARRYLHSLTPRAHAGRVGRGEVPRQVLAHPSRQGVRQGLRDRGGHPARLPLPARARRNWQPTRGDPARLRHAQSTRGPAQCRPRSGLTPARQDSSFILPDTAICYATLQGEPGHLHPQVRSVKYACPVNGMNVLRLRDIIHRLSLYRHLALGLVVCLETVAVSCGKRSGSLTRDTGTCPYRPALQSKMWRSAAGGQRRRDRVRTRIRPSSSHHTPMPKPKPNRRRDHRPGGGSACLSCLPSKRPPGSTHHHRLRPLPAPPRTLGRPFPIGFNRPIAPATFDSRTRHSSHACRRSIQYSPGVPNTRPSRSATSAWSGISPRMTLLRCEMCTPIARASARWLMPSGSR